MVVALSKLAFMHGRLCQPNSTLAYSYLHRTQLRPTTRPTAFTTCLAMMDCPPYMISHSVCLGDDGLSPIHDIPLGMSWRWWIVPHTWYPTRYVLAMMDCPPYMISHSVCLGDDGLSPIHDIPLGMSWRWWIVPHTWYPTRYVVLLTCSSLGAVAEWVRAQVSTSRDPEFESHPRRFESWASSFTPRCLSL